MKEPIITADDAKSITKGYPRRFQNMLKKQVKEFRKRERAENAEKFNEIMKSIKVAAEAGRNQVIFNFYYGKYKSSHPLVRRLKKYGYKWRSFTKEEGAPNLISQGVTW